MWSDFATLRHHLTPHLLLLLFCHVYFFTLREVKVTTMYYYATAAEMPCPVHFSNLRLDLCIFVSVLLRNFMPWLDLKLLERPKNENTARKPELVLSISALCLVVCC